MTNLKHSLALPLIVFIQFILPYQLLADNSCNQFTNPEFDNGLTDWQSWGDPAQVINSEAYIAITNPGADPWSIGFAQNGSSLEQGKEYQLSYEARSTANRPLTVKLGQNGAPYTSYVFYNDNLTTAMTTFTHVFTMNDASDFDTRLEFHLGGFNGDVIIDNVCLMETSCSIQNCELVGPEPFDSGLGNFSCNGCTASINNGTATIDIPSTTPNPWDVKFAHTPVALTQGSQYEISFDARAQTNRSIKLVSALGSAPFTQYSNADFALTTTMESYKTIISMRAPSDPSALIEFYLGVEAADVVLDNIYIRSVGCGQTTQVELTVFLEGCYDLVADKLIAGLHPLGLLPGEINNNDTLGILQPYQGAPWYYTGREMENFNENSYNNIALNTGNGTVIDWVLVAFREDATPTTTVGKKAGLLMENGTVVFPEPVDFLVDGETYYVKIDHWSHIGVMSPTSVAVTGDVLTFDFTTQNSYLSGAGSASKEIKSGVWAMFAGNCEQENQIAGYDINGNDRLLWNLANGIFNKYLSADMNQDGDINGDDRIIWDANNGVFSNLQSSTDQDNDGVLDASDNCPSIDNPLQEDADSDNEGDVCDATPYGIDNDGDGFFPYGTIPDPDDNDECIPDNARPNCDADGDGVINSADNCPNLPGDPTNNGCPINAFPTDILVHARGFVGTEDIELEINGTVVHTWNELPTTLMTYTHTVTTPVVLTQLRVNLIDGGMINGQDQNIQVDYVEIDGIQYQTEDPTTESLGTYEPATGCAQGFKSSDQLHCTGWLEYDVPAITVGGPPQPNEAPEIVTYGGQNTTVNHSENVNFSVDLEETDNNAGDDHDWTIIGGSDMGEFSINSITGVLSLSQKDFEMPIDSDQNNVYEVMVQVSDNGNPMMNDQININVNITDQHPEVTGHVKGSTYIAPTAPTYLPVYDTAWQMFGLATPAQAANYFAALRSYGFTGTWASVLHHAPARLNDNFKNGGQMGSIINGEVVLSPAYIARVNAILDEAELAGMKVGMLVNWQNLYLPGGGADSGNPKSNQVRGIIDESNACAYGLQMINAFGSHPALSMWVLGGDAGGNNYNRQKGIWEIMANCMIPLTDLEFNHHLPTAYSVSNPNGDGHLNYQDAYWLQMVAPETGHTQGHAQTQAQLTTAVNAYSIPVWQGEARYFGINYPWVGSYINPGVAEMVADAQAAENAGVGGYVYGNGRRWGWCLSSSTQPCNPNNIGATFGPAETAVINVFSN